MLTDLVEAAVKAILYTAGGALLAIGLLFFAAHVYRVLKEERLSQKALEALQNLPPRPLRLRERGYGGREDALAWALRVRNRVLETLEMGGDPAWVFYVYGGAPRPKCRPCGTVI